MTKLFDIASLPTRGGYRRSRWLELFEKSEKEIPVGKCREFTKSMTEVTNAYYCLQRIQAKRGRFTDLKIYKVGNKGFIGKLAAILLMLMSVGCESTRRITEGSSANEIVRLDDPNSPPNEVPKITILMAGQSNMDRISTPL